MKKRNRYNHDLPEDLPSSDDEIWQAMGMEEFDDDCGISNAADRADKARLQAIYEEEDRQDFLKQQRQIKKKQQHHETNKETKSIQSPLGSPPAVS